MSQPLERMESAANAWCGRSWEALVERRHEAFSHAGALRRATDADSIAVVSGFLEFFESTGIQLMRDEEEWIFRTLRPAPKAVINALEEHIAISSLIESLLNEARVGCLDLRLVHRLGELLGSHLLTEEEEIRPLATQLPRLTLAR